MNMKAANVTHTLLAKMVSDVMRGVTKYYDTDRDKALNLMRPIIVLGKPGIGKTVAIRELAKRKLKIGFKEVRLASMSELDLGGLPMVEEGPNGAKFTTYAASKLLPNEERDGEYGVLVFDEITSCSRACRAAALSVLDSTRGVGEYVLPDKWMCVCLGNDADDGGIYEGFEGAFVNRCRVVRLEPDYASWEMWADEHGINSTIMAFLRAYPELFYVDPDEGDTRIKSSPRAWEGVATQLDFSEELAGGRIDSNNTEMFIACVASDITPDLAARLSAFYAYNKQMIEPEKILDAKKPEDITELLKGSDAGAQESIYLTIESAIALLIKRTQGAQTNNLAAEQVDMIGNFIRFAGLLQQKKGGEAAATSLEQLCRRVKPVIGLLSNKNFRTKYPTEFKMLVEVADKVFVQ